jgi:ATP:ADP antiporter, AAA family
MTDDWRGLPRARAKRPPGIAGRVQAAVCRLFVERFVARVVGRFVGRFVDLRPFESGGLFWAFSYFFFLLASYYVVRPLRDEMAIAGGVNRLPWLFTATLVLMVLAVPIWSALAARLPTRRLIAIVYRFFLANLLLFFVLFQFPVIHVVLARALFVWTSVFNLFVVSVFWSFMADVFQQHQGKRLFGFVAAGGSAGAIMGPLITSTIVGRIGPVNLLLIAALLLEAASQCAARLATWSTRPPPPSGQDGIQPRTDQPFVPASPGLASPGLTAPGLTAPGAGDPQPGIGEKRDSDAIGSGVGGGAWAGLRLLFTSSYLGGIAAYVLLLTGTATLGYMLQARLVVAEGLTPSARTALFARIDLVVNIGAAAVQALLAGRVLARFGVGPALLLGPILTIASALALGALPRLSVLICGNVTRRVAEYAVSRPAREVLFTVVTREEKYKPKSLIDTVVYRAGDASSSWLFTAIERQGVGVPVLALCAIPLAVVWLAVAVWLGRRHEQRVAART